MDSGKENRLSVCTKMLLIYPWIPIAEKETNMMDLGHKLATYLILMLTKRDRANNRDY